VFVSSYESDRRFLDQFIESRTRDFVGRTALLDGLVQHAVSMSDGDEWGLCLTANPGVGKSAIFSALARRLQTADIIVLAHAAGLGHDSSKVDRMLGRWLEELASHLGVDVPDDLKGKELEGKFCEFLGDASRQRRVVLLIDAIDQFEPTPRGRFLTWLPTVWPANARLIASTVPSTTSSEFGKKVGLRVLEVDALTKPESAAVVEAICSRYHRQVPDAVVSSLLEKACDDGSQSAGNPLWLELAVEELNLLDADDFQRAEQEFAGPADEQLVRLMLSVVAEMPPSVAELYAWLLIRAEKLFGAADVGAFATLIAAGRSGWRESDFSELMPSVGGNTWDALRFAGLRRAFRAHVVQRGSFGQWNFAHAQMREAVFDRYLSESDRRRTLHSQIAEHLQNMPTEDPVRLAELMMHLLSEGDASRIVEYYANYFPGGGPLVDGSGDTDAVVARTVTDEAAGISPPYLAELLSTAQLGDERLHNLCSRVIAELSPALWVDTQLGTQLAILEAARDRLVPLVEAAPITRESAFRSHPAEDLAACDDRLGDILVQVGDLNGARAAYERSISLRGTYAKQEPTRAETWQRYLSISYGKLAGAYQSEGDLEAAIKSYAARVRIDKRQAALIPEDCEAQSTLAEALGNLGAAQLEAGDLNDASASCDESLAIIEGLSHANPERWCGTLAMAYIRNSDVERSIGNQRASREFCERALEAALHYAALDPGSFERQELVEAAHEQLSDLFLAVGDTTAASAANESALAIAKDLAVRRPEVVWWQRNLANQYLRKGKLALHAGDQTSARVAVSAGREISSSLASLDPKNAEWQSDLASANERLADIELAEGNIDSAIALQEDRRNIFYRLADLDPKNSRWRKFLINTHAALGDLYEGNDDKQEARDEYDAGCAIAQQFGAMELSSPDILRAGAHCEIKIADLLFNEDQLQEAHSHYYRAAEVLLSIDEEYAGSFEIRFTKAMAYFGLGKVLFENYQPGEAEGMFENALRLALELSEEHPANLDCQRLAWSTSLRISDSRVLLGDLSGAVTGYEFAKEVIEKMRKLEPNNTETFGSAALTHVKLATLYQMSGHENEAFDELTRARMYRSTLASVYPNNAKYRNDEAALLYQLKQCADAMMAKDPNARVLVDEMRSLCINLINSLGVDGLPIDDALVQALAELSAEVEPSR